MTKKKPKLKTQNIIIFANIIILLGIIFFYTYRLVHFYRIEHPKIEKSLTLNEIITLKKNIVTFGSGLYKVKDGYIYKGNDINNYLEYSGYLFRVLSIDKDGNIKVITDDSLTNLAWGLEDSYENSYVKSWLDGQDEHAGIFYKR